MGLYRTYLPCQEKTRVLSSQKLAYRFINYGMSLLLPGVCFFFPFVRASRESDTYKIRIRFVLDSQRDSLLPLPLCRCCCEEELLLLFLLFSCEHKSLFALRATAFFTMPTMHARVHAAELLSSKSFVARHYVQRGGSNRKRILVVHSLRTKKREQVGSRSTRFVKSVFAFMIKIVLVIYLNS